MAFLWLISVLMLFSTLHSNELQLDKFCEFLKPNGHYDGMGLFKQYSMNANGSHYMYNRRGAQWRFELSENHSRIVPVPEAIETINRTIIQKLGISINHDPWGNEWTTMWANCYIERKDLAKLICKTQFNTLTEFRSYMLVDSIIFRGFAGDYLDAPHSVILRKEDKRIEYLRSMQTIEMLSFEVETNCSTTFKCPNTAFIDQMDGSLLSQLDSVVDVNQAYPGFLLLFKIAGRPMFCFQKEETDLSDDCKSIENLKPIFEECFLDGWMSYMQFDPLYWVLIIEVVLMVILLVACYVMIGVRRRRFESIQSSVGHTSNIQTTSSENYNL